MRKQTIESDEEIERKRKEVKSQTAEDSQTSATQPSSDHEVASANQEDSATFEARKNAKAKKIAQETSLAVDSRRLPPSEYIRGADDGSVRTKNRDAEEPRWQTARVELRPAAKYGLKEIAEKVGLYPQYILNLINRYEFLDPPRLDGENYLFSDEDIAKIEQLQYLTDRGKTIREAAAIVYYEKEYRVASQNLFAALHIRFSEGSWHDFIVTLSQNADLEPQEQKILVLIEGERKTLLEAAIASSLRTEREARNALNNAYSKLGFALVYLLRNRLKLVQALPSSFESEKRYGPTEAAKRVGYYPQYVLNLARRFDLLSSGRSGSYTFDEEDIRKMLQVKYFVERGKGLGEAVAIVSREKEYEEASQKIANALGIDSIDEEGWQRFVDIISRNAELEEQEESMFRAVEGGDQLLLKAAAAAGLGTEREAKNILNSAYSKLGFTVLHMLRIGIAHGAHLPSPVAAAAQA